MPAPLRGVKPDGYATRYWGIYIDGELLAVVLYRKGTVAIGELITRTRSGEMITC